MLVVRVQPQYLPSARLLLTVDSEELRYFGSRHPANCGAGQAGETKPPKNSVGCHPWGGENRNIDLSRSRTIILVQKVREHMKRD